MVKEQGSLFGNVKHVIPTPIRPVHPQKMFIGPYHHPYVDLATLNVPQPFHAWDSYRGACDPCPPLLNKTYVTPPNLFISFQPPLLPQFSAILALRHGTLWPALYSPYPAICISS